VTKHLSAQARPGQARSKGRALFLVSKQNLNERAVGASDTLTIVENILEMRKLQLPKVKGLKNSNK
jgi:hypothetical protein